MYYSHYGLNGPPFPITPSRDLIYMSVSHREAYATLEWALHDANGFALIVGEPGTGKSSLISALLQTERDGILIICRRQPLAFTELLQSVAAELDINVAGVSLNGLARLIKNRAASLNSRVVLIFDEAQGLDDATLERLRLFADDTADASRPIQLILVAHPELRARLKQPTLRSLDQRIVTRAELRPLRRGEMHEYVDHRLRLCGATADRLFTAPALRTIVRQSRGIPRLINLICHNALILAYAAGSTRVNYRKVRTAADEYKGGGVRTGVEPLRRLLNRCASLRPLLQRPAQRPVFVASILTLLLLPSGLQSDIHERLFSRYAVAVQPSSSDLSETVLVPAAPPAAPASVARDAAQTVLSGTLQSHIVVAPADAPARQPAGENPVPPSDPTQITTAAPPTANDDAIRTVVIHEGDTLYSVARANFGSDDPEVIRRLLAVNPQLPDANVIHPGQVIQMPPVSR